MKVAMHAGVAVQLPECLVPVVVPDFLAPTAEVTNRAVGRVAKAVLVGKADLLLVHCHETVSAFLYSFSLAGESIRS